MAKKYQAKPKLHKDFAYWLVTEVETTLSDIHWKISTNPKNTAALREEEAGLLKEVEKRLIETFQIDQQIYAYKSLKEELRRIYFEQLTFPSKGSGSLAAQMHEFQESLEKIRQLLEIEARKPEEFHPPLYLFLESLLNKTKKSKHFSGEEIMSEFDRITNILRHTLKDAKENKSSQKSYKDALEMTDSPHLYGCVHAIAAFIIGSLGEKFVPDFKDKSDIAKGGSLRNGRKSNTAINGLMPTSRADVLTYTTLLLIDPENYALTKSKLRNVMQAVKVSIAAKEAA